MLSRSPSPSALSIVVVTAVLRGCGRSKALRGREAVLSGAEGGYQRGFEAEREWQLAWLTERLDFRSS